jgi:hypothetical protein
VTVEHAAETAGDVSKKWSNGVRPTDEGPDGCQGEALQKSAKAMGVGELDPGGVRLLPEIEKLLPDRRRDQAGAGLTPCETGMEDDFQVRGLILDGRAGQEDEGRLADCSVGMSTEPPEGE